MKKIDKIDIIDYLTIFDTFTRNDPEERDLILNM